MTKRKRAILVVLGIVLLLAAVSTVFAYGRHLQAVRIEREKQELRDRERAYLNQNYAFCAYGYTDGIQIYEMELEERYGESMRDYHSYRDYSYVWEPGLYCELITYQYYTGTVLTVEEVKEYLSQEFEEDGSLRLYTNGLHPTIHDFVARRYVAYSRIPEMHLDEVPDALDNKTTARHFQHLIEEYLEEHPEDKEYLRDIVEEQRVASDFFKAGREIDWYGSYDLLGMDILQEFGKKLLDPDYEIVLR